MRLACGGLHRRGAIASTIVVMGLAKLLIGRDMARLGARGYDRAGARCRRGAIYHGLYGFNAVLTGIALGGLFRVLVWQSTIYAFIGAIFSAIVFAVIAVALSPIGMPALTAPFVLTTWVFPAADDRLQSTGAGIGHRVRLDKVLGPTARPQSRPARSRLRRLEAFGTRCYFGFGA